MEIVVKKITKKDLSDWAFSMTSRNKLSPKLIDVYKWEHSPIRTQIFMVEMIGIPTFVSVHFVRHKIGVEHFVLTNRDDRGGDTKANRMTPVNHGMLINAEALINMARKRLCGKAHPQTQAVMMRIKEAIKKVDSSLYKYLVPNCEYRGKCVEPNPCKAIK